MSEDIKVTDGTVLETLNGKVDIDFNNVPSNSVSFARMSREVTNCILEIPQRIKYTLVDGTLTIKAGSVVIVPYGTEDLTADYPKGATFLHENFKVYDTQFEDGKFFVWVEIQSDIVRTSATSNVNTRVLCVIVSENSTSNNVTTASGDGSSLPTQESYLYYNTTTNLFISKNSGVILDYVISLPIMLTQSTETYNVDSILQVFNGMGYIGSTVWVDKGVKFLIPNGRNEDGSLNNVEDTSDKLYLRTFTTGMNNTNVNFLFQPNNTEKPIGYVLSTRLVSNWQDINYLKDVDGTIYQGFMCATGDITNGVITSFNPKQPVNLATIDDVDGKVNVVSISLLESYSLAKGKEITIDLSQYLPNDGNIYECVFDYRLGTANNSSSFIYYQTDIAPATRALWRGRSFSTSAIQQGGGTFIDYVGMGRSIRIVSTSSSTGNTEISILIASFRKVI